MSCIELFVLICVVFFEFDKNLKNVKKRSKRSISRFVFFVNFLTKLDYTMKKTTTKKSITRRVAEYGAAASILGIGADASGQIVYTDINPDAGGFEVLYFLDFDNDGVPEYNIENSNYSFTYFGISFNVNVLYGSQSSPYNAILGVSHYLGNSISGGYIGYPFALNAGDVISAGNSSWIDNTYNLFTVNSCNGVYSFGQNAQDWCGVTDKYLGFKFMIGANTHYGWARLDVTNQSNWAIKDYAYNATPDAPIEAGQTVLGLGDNFVKTVKVVGLKNTIALYNLPDSADYKVISMTGKTLLSGETNGEYYVIENETISTGVYIVELTNKTTGEQLRKKVIL